MNYLKIGFIKKPHGLKGELKVLPLTDDFVRFKNLKNIYLFLSDIYVEKEIQSVKITDSDIILKLKEYDSVSEVENLRNSYLFIDKNDAIPLKEWEFYTQDLIGCDVFYQKEKIGVVLDLINSGANDNLLINYKNKEYFFPFLRQYMDNIDVENKIIEINQFDGFFD